MRILPILNTNITYNKTCKYKDKSSFKAHPDFYKYNSTFSCYFRRGAVGLSCSKGYEDIENLFCKIFEVNENIPKKMLIAGIGNSQEPFSYLSSIKGIIKNKSLERNVDLYIVDLQSKPEHTKLKKDAFCDLPDYQSFPKYAEKSFVKDSTNDWLGIKHEDNLNLFEKYMYKIFSNMDRFKELNQKGYSLESIYKIIVEEEKQKSLRWRVNNEIFEFLEKTYNQPQKSKWDSRIQEAILDYPNNEFNVISANNILPYIISERESAQTVENIVRTLKRNGYCITDPYNNPYHVKVLSGYDNMKQIASGIYQKI